MVWEPIREPACPHTTTPRGRGRPTAARCLSHTREFTTPSSYTQPPPPYYPCNQYPGNPDPPNGCTCPSADQTGIWSGSVSGGWGPPPSTNGIGVSSLGYQQINTLWPHLFFDYVPSI